MEHKGGVPESDVTESRQKGVFTLRDSTLFEIDMCDAAGDDHQSSREADLRGS